jgi:hypothetical protein
VTPAGQVILRAGAKLYMPCIALFAFALLSVSHAGLAQGLAAGLALALGYSLHVIVMGAEAAQRAAPQWLLRGCLALGLMASVAAAAAPRWIYSEMVGVFAMALATAGALALALAMLAGRAPSLRDEEW